MSIIKDYPENKPSKGLKGWQIALIVIGSIFAVSAIITSFICLKKKRVSHNLNIYQRMSKEAET